MWLISKLTQFNVAYCLHCETIYTLQVFTTKRDTIIIIIIAISLSSSGLTLAYSEWEGRLLNVGINIIVEITFQKGRDLNTLNFEDEFGAWIDTRWSDIFPQSSDSCLSLNSYPFLTHSNPSTLPDYSLSLHNSQKSAYLK